MKDVMFIAFCMALTMFSMAFGQDSARSIENALIGKWSVQIGSYSDTWTFEKGGVVSSQKQPALKGEWKNEKNCILIQWDETSQQGYRTWEAFTLPLNTEGMTRGGNWNGMKVFATKMKK
jgi:hypothetical protein